MTVGIQRARPGLLVAATLATILAHGPGAETRQSPAVNPEPPKTRHVEPLYPPEAKAQGLRGAVVLQLTIAGSGRVIDVAVLRSNPPFDQPAIDAVKQWQYDMTGLTAPHVSTVTVIIPSVSPQTRAGTSSTSRTRPAEGPAAAGPTPIDVFAPGVLTSQAINAEIRRLSDVIRQAPAGAARRVALRERGFLYATSGRGGLARRDLDLVLADDDRDAAAHFALGLASFDTNPKNAISAFAHVIRLQPDRADGYRGRAWANLVAGEFGDATSDFGQVIRRDPQDAEAYRGRGWAHLHARRYDAALADFNDLERRMRHHPEASFGRGLAHHFDGKTTEAQMAFRSTMRMIPGKSSARTFHDVSLDDWSRFRRVLERLTERTKSRPQDIDAWLAHGVTSYRQLSDSRTARSRSGSFDRILAIEPGHIDALLFRAMANIVPGISYQPKLAIADLSEIVRLQPRHTEAYLRRALIYAVDKETLPQAIDDCRRALATVPGDEKVQALLARFEEEHRDWQLRKQAAAVLRAQQAQAAEERAMLLWGAIAVGLAFSTPPAPGTWAWEMDQIGWGMMGMGR